MPGRGPSADRNGEAALVEGIDGALARPDVVELHLSAIRTKLQTEALAAASDDIQTLEAELAEVKREHRRLVRLAAKLDAKPDGEYEDDGVAELPVEIKACRV